MIGRPAKFECTVNYLLGLDTKILQHFIQVSTRLKVEPDRSIKQVHANTLEVRLRVSGVSVLIGLP